LNDYRPSIILFTFWFFFTIISIIKLRSSLLRLNETTIDPTLIVIHLILIITSLILSVLPLKIRSGDTFTISNDNDKKIYKKVKTTGREVPDDNDKNQIDKEYSPHEVAPLLSRLTFWWINKLISIGYKRDLTKSDLFNLNPKNKSKIITETFDKLWAPKVQIYINKIRQLETETTEPDSLKLKIDQISKPSLIKCLSKMTFYKLIGLLLLRVVHDLLNFVKPLCLDKLITFVKLKDQSYSIGIFYIFLLLITSISQTVLMQHIYYGMHLFGNKLYTSLVNAIYNKSLRLTPAARKQSTLGEMTNLITTNASSFTFCSFYLIGAITCPIQIIIYTIMLWNYLGIATLAGLGSILLFMPFNGVFVNRGKVFRKRKFKLQDSRIKLMNEILIGIRVIKFYGWELSFQKMVEKIRKKEIKTLIQSSLISAASSLYWACAPVIVAGVAFGTFLLIDKNNNLDPNTAFVSLTLFNMLRFPLNILPNIINGLVQTSISSKRIQLFLLRDEIDHNQIGHDQTNDNNVIKVQNVSLCWSRNSEILQNISFNVKQKQLVAIVGKVGSGKSSLLSGLLGEMYKTKGELKI
jgi:ABC-type bacteriocin/lantibiotic exporter with double-glycine peptidase domain